MKKQYIFRTSDKKGATGYTTVTNEIIKSKDLSMDETGLLIYLLSLPVVGFRPIQKNILKDLKNRISAGRFRTAWSGLVEKGYIVEDIYYKDNLRRVEWLVFENPDSRESGNRESRNRKSREPELLKRKEIEKKEIESKKVKSNNINNTGSSILGENIETKKSRESIPSFYMIEVRDAAATNLTGATIIGAEILSYSNPDKHQDLLNRIGNIQFDLIKDELAKYDFAIQQLEKNNSSSTGEPAPPDIT
jgi:hypothetical protein